jgi:acyl-CoA reductase-like NAD-dependent aldehyde dehydrogenase
MQELTHYHRRRACAGHVGPVCRRVQPRHRRGAGEALPAGLDRRGRAGGRDRRRAQPGWAAVNPQRRARVMMKFVSLLHRDMDKLAEALSASTARRCPTPRRRAARARSGGVLHRRAPPAEGRIHRQRRPRHRHVFDAPAAGVTAGHHALQLPRHDPDVDVRARPSPAATRSSSSRPSATPRCR